MENSEREPLPRISPSLPSQEGGGESGAPERIRLGHDSTLGFWYAVRDGVEAVEYVRADTVTPTEGYRQGLLRAAQIAKAVAADHKKHGLLCWKESGNDYGLIASDVIRQVESALREEAERKPE